MARKARGRKKTAAPTASSTAVPAATDIKETPKVQPKRAKAQPKTAKRSLQRKVRTVTKTSGRGKRYSDAERAKILVAATRDGLTGAQVSARFGVSTLTYYTWRKKAGKGPVRRAKSPGKQPQGSGDLTEQVRLAIRARVRELMPGLIKQEVSAALTPVRRKGRR